MNNRGIDWTGIFKDHRGEWVALKDDETTVIASGKSAKRVFKQAQKKGVVTPILLRVPQTSLLHIGQFYAV